MNAPVTRPARSDDRTDWPAMIAALQIRADHHADVITRLIDVIARLTVRIEALEGSSDGRQTRQQ